MLCSEPWLDFVDFCHGLSEEEREGKGIYVQVKIGDIRGVGKKRFEVQVENQNNLMPVK